MRLSPRALAGALALLLGTALTTPARSEALDRYLVGRWTFANGSLQSTPPGLPLAPKGVGADQTHRFADGFLTLGAGRLFFCPGLSAERFSGLAGGVTLWARMRFDAPPPTPAAMPCFLALMARAEPGDWGDIVLGAICKGDAADGVPHLGIYGAAGESRSFGTGPSRMLPVKIGSEMAIAISFDGATGTSVIWVDGASAVDRLPSVSALRPFAGLGLGRVKDGAKSAVSFREVRVYSIAMTPEWMGEIAADAAP